MTSKLVVNTIEADTGISSVSFASSISLSSTSKFHFGNAGIDIGADTNINRPASGVIGFNINSGEKVRINSNGFIGINTSSPLAPLHTYNDTNNTIARLESGDATCRLQLVDSAGMGFVAVSGDNLILANTSSITERVRITSAGKVGIATDTGNGLINTRHAGTNQQVLHVRADLGSSNNRTLNLYTPDTDSTETPFRFQTGNGYLFQCDNENVFTIAHDRRIGIGTDIPTYKLHVDSGDAAIGLWKSRRSSGSYIDYSMGANGAALGYIGAGGQIISSSGADSGDFAIRSQGDLLFSSGGSVEKLRIDSSYARVGINTNTFDGAGSQLKIEGRGTGTTTPPYLQIKGVGNGNLHAYVDLIATSSNNTNSGNPSEYRGMGVVMLDEPSNKEWYAGRPYAGSDKFIIGRKASPSYRTQSAEVANELVRISSEGYVTKSNQPSFLVAPANDAATINGFVTYTTVYHNNGTHYSTSNGRFTAPVTGYYTFFANYVGHSGSNNVFVRFYINGNYNNRGQHYSGTGRATQPYMSCDTTATHTLLQANDYVQLHLACSGHDRGQAGYMRFCGYLVH